MHMHTWPVVHHMHMHRGICTCTCMHAQWWELHMHRGTCMLAQWWELHTRHACMHACVRIQIHAASHLIPRYHEGNVVA